jgi:hypothetical protein
VTVTADDRSTIEIDLFGLTGDVVDRLEALVADGRGAPRIDDSTSQYVPDVARRPADPAHALVLQLDGELRRFRQLAVHEVLGVPRDASAMEVRAAWRRLCQRFHPDVVASHGSAAVSHLAEELTIMANRAYDRMRASLIAEGRASALGPALRPEKGWLVSFEAISTGEIKVSFGTTTELVFDELAADQGHQPDESSLAAARGATDNVFEKQARAKLSAGDHEAAREVLAAALYVYPRHRPLRALYHVASALQALDAGQPEHASAQLDAALSADPDCKEAKSAIEDLRRKST